MEITLEEIQKKFESLPEDLKWAVMAANVDENIIDIGQAQGLNVEQMGQLSLETHMVMFGFTHPDKFEESVKNRLNLPDEKIRAIVNVVNEKILKEIRAKAMGSPNKETIKPEIPPTSSDNDAQILDSAGIQIVNEPARGALPNNASEEKLKKDMRSILAQKLSAPVQNPVVKTEHTLDNLTKASGGLSQPNTQKEVPKSGYAVDPYRIPPEA